MRPPRPRGRATRAHPPLGATPRRLGLRLAAAVAARGIMAATMAVRLNEEQLMIQRSVRELAQARIAPRAAGVDEQEESPRDGVELFRTHDLLALPCPP